MYILTFYFNFVFLYICFEIYCWITFKVTQSALQVIHIQHNISIKEDILCVPMNQNPFMCLVACSIHYCCFLTVLKRINSTNKLIIPKCKCITSGTHCIFFLYEHKCKKKTEAAKQMTSTVTRRNEKSLSLLKCCFLKDVLLYWLFHL